MGLIRRLSDVLDSILLTVVLELLSCELCTIVRNEHLWVSLHCENPAQLFYCCSGCWSSHLHNFRLLGEGIHHDEKHHSFHRSGKINMDPLPSTIVSAMVTIHSLQTPLQLAGTNCKASPCFQCPCQFLANKRTSEPASSFWWPLGVPRAASSTLGVEALVPQLAETRNLLRSSSEYPPLSLASVGWHRLGLFWHLDIKTGNRRWKNCPFNHHK